MKLALHICCGVCAAGVVERLKAEGHEVHGYFYNPNIYPRQEYEKRLDAARKVSLKMGFPLEEGPFTPEEWFKETRALAAEPEGGKRCEVCFNLRLEKTYRYMLESGLEAFTTTLTVSPLKKAAVVNRIGRIIGGYRFLDRDFKKKAGFQRSVELAREMDLYHQNYCGCLYSIRKD
jgi:predicted adenine nucleotide alpha hydrolase (AANH) superfamily ATPase